MGTIGNINVRVGADASQLTTEMKKAQNTILTFKNESMTALKSFGIPNINSTDLVESIKSGQRTIVEFTQESNESLAQFSARVQQVFLDAGLDVDKYDVALTDANKVNVEFANGAVKSFRAVQEESNIMATNVSGRFGEMGASIRESMAMAGDSSLSFEERMGALGSAVKGSFDVMGIAMEAFMAIQFVKTVEEWCGGLEKLDEKAEDTQHRLEASMGGMSDSATAFAENLSNTWGVSLMGLKDMLGKEYLNVRMLGFNQAESNQMAETITKLSYSIAKIRGQDPQQVFDKLRAGVEGQPRGLSELGTHITEVDIKNRAMAEGFLKSGQTMSDQTKSLMIYQILLQKFGSTQDYYGTTTNDLSTQTTTLSTRFEELKVHMASELEPVMKTFTEGLLAVVSAISGVSDGFTNAIKVINWYLLTMGDAIHDIINLDFSFDKLTKHTVENWDEMFKSAKKTTDAYKAFGEQLDTTITASIAYDDMKNTMDAANEKPAMYGGGGAPSSVLQYYQSMGTVVPDTYDPHAALVAANKAAETTANKAADAMKKFDDSVKTIGSTIQSQVSSFDNFVGLFDKINRSGTSSGESLLNRLKKQVEEMKNWQSALNTIQGKLGPGNQDLMNALTQMGPGSARQLTGLSKLSASELTQYAQLYGQKNQLAWSETQNTIKMEHTGNIYVKGVDSKDEMKFITEIIAKDLAAEKDRYATYSGASKALK